MRGYVAALALLLPAWPAGAQERSAGEQAAIEFVHRLGGKVELDSSRPGFPVVIVHVGSTGLDDAGLRQLAVFAELRSLILYNDPVTDTGLAYLSGLRTLQNLHLGRTRVTDAGLASLKGLTNLRRLWLAETAVTEAGIADLRRALPQLEVFRDMPRRPSPSR